MPESGTDHEGDKAEHQVVSEILERPPTPASAANENDLKTSVDLTTQTQLPVPEPAAGCDVHPSAPQTKVLCVCKDKDLKIVPSGSEPAQASDIDLSLIPPPSDFMDLPGPPPQPEEAKAPPPSEVISTGKLGATIDLELLRQRVSTKMSPPVTPEPLNNPPDLSPRGVSLHTSPPESAEHRSPPAVAPKPKKLPANIILKSHKTAASDSSSGHSVPTCSDRILLDPQRVRIEALRKLGLLKSDEADSGPILSPKHSPQNRRSWAAPSPPVSPAPHTPPTTPSYSRLSTPSSASIPPQSPFTVSPSTPPAVDLPHIVPAPPAFSDPDRPPLSDIELSAGKDISGADDDTADTAQVNTPPHTPPTVIKQLTPPKDKGFKSSTLEPSSLGPSSSMAVQDGSNKQSPSQLRNSRPRPASLGSGKEFSSTWGEGSQAGHASSREPDLRQSLPVLQHSGNSQKLPRSQGISVLICPRSENGDERREALRRLGLLRD